MGIREKINQNPKQTTAITAGIVLLAILFIFWQACGSGSGVGVVSDKAFFSTDDGKTFFVDSSSNIPPYMKDGKLAVRAQVFTCDDGKTKFVGYLEMYTPQEKAMLEQANKGPNKGAPVYAGFGGQAMVKRPGDPPTMWIPLAPQTTMAYQAVVQPKCPGGGSQENLSRVFPD